MEWVAPWIFRTAKVENVCPLFFFFSFLNYVLHNFCQFFGCCSAKSNRKTTREQHALKATARHPAVSFLFEMAQTFRSLKNKKTKHDPGENQLERKENGGLDKRMTNGSKNPAALFMGTQHQFIFEKGKKFKWVWFWNRGRRSSRFGIGAAITLLLCVPLNLIHNSLAEVIFLIASSLSNWWWWWWARSIRHIIPA